MNSVIGDFQRDQNVSFCQFWENHGSTHGSQDPGTTPGPPPGVHPVYPEVPWLYHMTWVEIKLLFSLIDWFDFTLEGVPGADFDECYKINLQI